MARLWPLLVTWLLVLGPLSGHSQTLVAKGGIDERYTDVAPTSGFLLAGLVYGYFPGTFDATKLALNVPPAFRKASLCLRLATRDGRYRGLARYDADAEPFSFVEFRSRFSSELHHINRDELAPRVVVSSSCQDGSNGTILPMTIDGRQWTSSLVALVNAGDARVRARLLGPSGEALTAAVPCESVSEGANIVFSQACKISISGLPKADSALLELSFIELTGGKKVHQYKMHLSSR